MEGERAQKGLSVGGKGGRGAAVILITGLSEVYQPSCGDIGHWGLAVLATDSSNVYTLCKYGNFYHRYLFICYKVDKNVSNLNFGAENTETDKYQTFSPSTFEAHFSPNDFSVNTKPCGLVKKIPARVWNCIPDKHTDLQCSSCE